MSFLAPLYALGALAIGLPILFHLVRRHPKDKQTFSSLMFLEPAPPRLTKHSQIEQWFLLMLRIAVIALLAIAFSRPYWNVPAETETQATGARRLILLDTSASMRRAGLFDKALARAKVVLQQASVTDLLSVYAFNESLVPLLSLDEAIQAPVSQRQTLAIASLSKASPTWFATDLGMALRDCADLLQADNDPTSDAATLVSEIVVVTDFQNGAMLDKLIGYNWPSSCRVKLERVEPSAVGNAYASLLEGEESSDTADGKPGSEDSRRSVRVKLSNELASPSSQLSLAWRNVGDQIIVGSENQFKVPAGESLIVRMPTPAEGASALFLSGDSSDFDNRHFVTTPETKQSTLICMDDPTRSPEDSLSYFVEQLPLSTAGRTVQYVNRKPGSDSPKLDVTQTPLVIASHELSERDASECAAYVEQGGHLLWVWDAIAGKANRDTQWAEESYGKTFEKLTQSEATIHESATKNYAMFEQVNFKHPLLSELADSRFNDFTKVRIWSHRSVTLKSESEWQILARYDDQSPALIGRAQGKGFVWILTTGWQPNQSQLALSSKFVPLIAGMFRLAAQDGKTQEQHWVGERFRGKEGDRLYDPTGKEVSLARNAHGSDQPTAILEQPGIYDLSDSNGRHSYFAVNLKQTESVVAPADIDKLERTGVIMSDSRPRMLREFSQRQLRAVELEAQQGWWRWIVVSVLSVIGIESLVCTLRTRKT